MIREVCDFFSSFIPFLLIDRNTPGLPFSIALNGIGVAYFCLSQKKSANISALVDLGLVLVVALVDRPYYELL
jgi:hypothetical protein